MVGCFGKHAECLDLSRTWAGLRQNGLVQVFCSCEEMAAIVKI